MRGQRVTISLLGDGYIAAIEDDMFLRIAAEQRRMTRGRISGVVVYAPVLEASGRTAVGRFGWKSQHASLLSSAADAQRTELGISSRLYPPEGGASGNPRTDGRLIEQLAAFIRGTAYPSRDAALAASESAQNGSQIFETIRCSACHVKRLLPRPLEPQ